MFAIACVSWLISYAKQGFDSILNLCPSAHGKMLLYMPIMAFNQVRRFSKYLWSNRQDKLSFLDKINFLSYHLLNYKFYSKEFCFS